MAYVKKIWKDYPDTTTPILASDMNNIENGIENIENNVNNIENGIEELDTRLNDEEMYVQATAGANGDFFVNLTNQTLVNGRIVKISFPTATNSSADARLSIDGGVTYKNILNVLSNEVQNKQIELKYNGLSFEIINSTSTTFLKLTSNQSLTTGTFTTILFGEKQVLQSGNLVEISSGIITVKESGLYLILLNSVFNTNATGGRYQDIRYNNNSFALATSSGLAGLRTSLSSFAVLKLNANDTLFCRAYQTSGGNLDLISDTSISIMRLQ